MNQNTLKYIAQQAHDRFNQTYESDDDFFDIDDFINFAGNAIGDIYQMAWKEKYVELRQERKDEVVTFDSGILSQQILKVPRGTSKISFLLPLEQPIMPFMYDENNCGLQAVYYQKSECDDFDTKAIRSTLIQKEALKKTVICDRVFYYLDGNKLGIVNRRFMPIDEIKLWYVPAIYPEMIVPEGIRQKVIDATVLSLKEAAKSVIINKGFGTNNNKVLQGEIDPTTVKP